MTSSRPFYAARILGTPDIPVSIHNDSGQLTLDSARAPHVEGSVTLSVEDATMLEDLDPRDNRRMVIDVHPESHLEPVYSDWVERQRNRHINPDLLTDLTGWGHFGGAAALTTARYVAPDTGDLTRPGYGAHFAATAAGIASAYVGPAVPVTAGETITVSFYLRRGSGWSGTATPRIEWSGGTRVTGTAVTMQQSPYIRYTLTATVPAGVTTARISVLVTAMVAGNVFRVRMAQIETGNAATEYIDGATPDPDALTQYRWLGAVNASASVMETRTLTGWEQVPDGTPRTFDLGIREANPDRGGATVGVQLASDEALAGDFAQLVDDKGPRAHETSLRAVVDYVLAKIGAHLEPDADDADVTAYWPVTNLIKNSLFLTTADGWGIWNNSSSITRVAFGTEGALRWTAITAADSAIATGALETVTPGKWYVFSVYVGGSSNRNASAGIRWWTGSGTTTMGSVYGASAPTPTTYPDSRVYVIAQAPAGADRAQPLVRTQGNNVGGIQYYIGRPMFYEGDEVVPFFHGGTADDGFYSYEWDDPSDPSGTTAKRIPVVERPPAALTWRAGDSAMVFLAPLVQASGFRLVCNERREWTLRTAEYREPGVQAFRYGVNVITANEQLSRSSDEWFDGAVFRYVWTDDDGIEQIRIDAYALPGASKIIRRDIQAPYPGPGRAQYAVRRAQGRGRTVTATKQADWTEDAEQQFSVLLDGTPIQVGIANSVQFDLASNEVTTTSRTTETPAGAIDLLPGTINALTGTINEL